MRRKPVQWVFMVVSLHLFCCAVPVSAAFVDRVPFQRVFFIHFQKDGVLGQKKKTGVKPVHFMQLIYTRFPQLSSKKRLIW